MIIINQGVIKDTGELCQGGKKYLDDISKALKLRNEFNEFDLGFFYKNSEDSRSTWRSIKSKLVPDKEKFKDLFPSIKALDGKTERPEKTVSALVELIKKDILDKLIALEKEHANKADRYHKLLEWLALISKRVSGLLIYGVAAIAMVAVAAAVLFGVGAFASTAASIVKLISANIPLVVAAISATLSLTGISHFISRYIIKKRDAASPVVGAAEEHRDAIITTLEKAKQITIDQTSRQDNSFPQMPIPSAPCSPLRMNSTEDISEPSISDAFGMGNN
ncbi:hypothetical protein [Rickettsiella endosymbiont of Dermanyssus gallinae]|uniref:hypothetical protein n=1 Tax=Rickettsiella endosymbiont of Dermanyssus gallinae TaxID=2856608 RepID=UPI001C530AA3|nr:hypothetical protein [Rickettsiella endosymbiont of Dermanyssus gallinae]